MLVVIFVNMHFFERQALWRRMPPLPSGWEEKFSKSKGIPYYHNMHTGETQWEIPTSPATASTQVRVSHILCKHAGSRRPSSWREVSPCLI